MEADAANWRWDELYGGKFHDGSFKNWSETRSLDFPYSHRAGVSVWVAPEDLAPDDDFLSVD